MIKLGGFENKLFTRKEEIMRPRRYLNITIIVYGVIK
tara:strand:- start:325 stop:435 length:111 start_codon:yes stop_codon:yes gene_type:complete